MLKWHISKVTITVGLLICVWYLQLPASTAQAALDEHVQWGDSMVVNLDGSKGSVNIYDIDQKLQAVHQNGKILIKQYDLQGNLKRTYLQREHAVYSLSNASLTVFVQQKNPDLRELKVAYWSDAVSRDNSSFVLAEKMSNGLWKAIIKFSELSPGTGKYHAMIQIDGKDIRQLEFQVVDTGKIELSPNLSLNDDEVTIRISGVSPTVKEVRFPTWTKANGQDDLKSPWIIGSKKDIDTWEIKIPYRDHNYETGNYITHIYSFDKYGNNCVIGWVEYTVQGGIKAPTKVDISDVSYDLVVYDIAESVQQVYFPTWSLNNGQDDVEWIQGIKEAPGVWRGTVIYAKHNDDLGVYTTHVYADKNMIQIANVTVENKSLVTAPKQAELKDGPYQVTVSGLSDKVSNVYFPTWTEQNWQDDLKIPYVKGNKSVNGDWTYTVNYRDHKYEAGNYITHVYTEDKHGNKRMIGGHITSVAASPSYPTKSKLIEKWYDVYVYGLPTATKNVQFPTWTSANDQDDLEWINGERVSEGVWRGRIFFDKHNGEIGSYITHIYVDEKSYHGGRVEVDS
ncbi:GBS Bsp-like repeat-containing protein [Paenibacillus sp. UMB4589-SE434]|uniref:GBS Bsp-like repeat-containing protein n=1 Tax=Paenibacillus sp. UMB4589-SE434 TaxID=3046314 RepID=UPI0025513B6B|nr:GBS Bsp-like repeat-containing protein [Paenibacillus sp. UMB4589-SE434]MDK8182617.1 GBS Bsp-like repeat-containing protein [Paenibacillus sp. UMB4589-SE434]